MNPCRHRSPVLACIISFALYASLLCGCAGQGTQSAGTPRFQSDINAFLSEDQINPPPKSSILFIGSSILRQWVSLNQQMAPLPVFNRAFGGSQTADILLHMEKIVLPYEPRIIVYYCGSNDINASQNAVAIAERFFEFCRRVHERLPATRIFYVSINRAPQKKTRWDVVDSTNAIVRKYCSATDRLAFIDVNPVLFDKSNNPRLELYQRDELHLTEQAYEGFAAIIKPVIERAWNER